MNYKIKSALNDFWYSKARYFFSIAYLMLARLSILMGNKKKAFKFSAASLRYGTSSSALILFKKIVSNYTFSLDEFSSGIEIKEASGRTMVLKWPTIQDRIIVKGVLAIKFTKTFSYYLRNIDIESLERYFILVLEPSWSGYADPDIFGFVGRSKKIIVQASELEDRVLLNCFPETFIGASFGASDWVDFRLFDDLKAEKIYDSIYIANTNPIKRVKRYLEAVAKIVKSGNDTYIGCLVCASWGGAESLVKDLVASYHLNDNLVVRFSVGRSDVVRYINQSKVNVLLSYKEGSNKSLFEAMFCNTPVICLSENIGVSKSYINEYTGLLIPDHLLESSLLWIGDNYSRFNPRLWALHNIAPPVTIKKLEGIICLLDECASDMPLYIKTNNPEYSYFDFPWINAKYYSESLLKLFDTNLQSAQVEQEIELISLKNKFLESLQDKQQSI